jgi:putative photosynthetic complex assembly protein 2
VLLGCGLPALYALLVWWLSTGFLVFLVRLPRRTYWVSLAGITVVVALALWGLAANRSDTTVLAAYISFSCAILVWAWPEMSLLTGLLTGPWRQPCPRGCDPWRRAAYAVRAILYHELALLAAGVAIIGVTWGGANPVGAWTFALLWLMRLSAKLNLFMGVGFFDDEFLPEHLRYLKSFFADRPVNSLFVVSMILSMVAMTALVRGTMSPHATAFEIASFALLASLLGLAMLEHCCLVLPLPLTSLWNWWLRWPIKPANDITADANVQKESRLRLPTDESVKMATQLGTPQRVSLTNSSSLTQPDRPNVRAESWPKPQTSASACQRLQERFRLEFMARSRVDTTPVCGSAGSDPSSTTNWRA